MSQQRQNKMIMMNQNDSKQFGVGDTTYTKIFVGGLAWETKKDTLKRYFDQFGEILEAVVITDKNTGRSKGYGFVTFKDPNCAMRACQNPYPVIDGRRANCNLAVLGSSQKVDPSIAGGRQKFSTSSPSWTTLPISFQGTSTYYNQHIPQYAYPYPAFRYPGYPPQQEMYEMNYYNAYGGQAPPYRWLLPAYYYQPIYGLSRQIIPTTTTTSTTTAFVKKTQFPDNMSPQESTTHVVALSQQSISSASLSISTTTTGTVDATKGLLESPQEQKSSIN